jgi:methylmalonyl-CoA/ethylmalonyl-CoA epimerase
MKLSLSHIAVASSQIKGIAEKLSVLGMKIAESHTVPSEKVNAAMIPVSVSDHFRIELLEPTDSESPIAKFLEKRPAGGVHHLSFEVENIEQWEKVLKQSGLEVLPPGIRKAARGRALFIHPKSMGGVLVELEEIKKG